MCGTWTLYRRLSASVLVVVVLATLGRSAPVPNADEDKLRERILKLNELTGEDPIQAQIRSLASDKEAAKKFITAALKIAKEKDQPLNLNTTYILARVAHYLKEVETSEFFYRLNAEQAKKLDKSRKYVDANLGLVDLLFQAKRFDDAEKACREFLKAGGDEQLQRMKIFAIHDLVRIQTRQGKAEDGMKVIDNLLKVDPKDWLTWEVKGWVLRETQKFEDAAKIYEDALAGIEKDPDLRPRGKDFYGARIRYSLSGVYVDLKKIDKAEEQLQALLGKEKDNATYHNDLGFIWADHDMKLGEAEKLIRKALELDQKQRRAANPNIQPDEDKDNAAYLDSLGWVLFKQKKYKEALPPLLEAVKQDEGQHLEIYDHLADVHLAMKELEKAVAAWKKGLTCPELSYRDKQRKIEVEKKLKAAEDKK